MQYCLCSAQHQCCALLRPCIVSSLLHASHTLRHCDHCVSWCTGSYRKVGSQVQALRDVREEQERRHSAHTGVTSSTATTSTTAAGAAATATATATTAAATSRSAAFNAASATKQLAVTTVTESTAQQWLH
eukprot:5105-Heterococcus_DN1.PRE.7